MAFSPAAVIEQVAAKPSVNRQDAVFAANKAVRERLHRRTYGLKATSITAPVWSANLGATVTSFPAFLHKDLGFGFAGPTPQAGDFVYAVTDAGTVLKYAADTGVVQNGAGWNALASLAGAGSVHESGVVLSADGTRLYLVSSGGYFVCLNASTGAQIYTNRLTSTSGFADTAVYIDYVSGAGGNENLYAVANDGSIYNLVYGGGATFTVSSWSAAAVGYPSAPTVRTYPVVWNRQAFFGDTSGRVHRVDFSTGSPVTTTWYPNLATSAASAAIRSPVAIDFDDNLAVTAIFVACGDRVAWIDPAQARPEAAVTVSPPLVVDAKAPATGSLAAYAYTGTSTKTYTATDWVSVAKDAAPAPSIWGAAASASPDKYVFGADGHATSGDGDTSYGYLRFAIPAGDFAGKSPVGATLSLSAATTSAAESLQVYQAENFVAGSATNWTGYASAPNVTAATRPSLIAGGAAVGSYSGAVTASSAASGLSRYTASLAGAALTDRANVSGLTTGNQTFALKSAGKARSGAVAWYPGTSGVTAPTLTVTLTSPTTPAGNGIMCQPAIDSFDKKVWVVGSNALFELDYTSAGTFQSRSNTRYDLTSAGLGGSSAPGPTSGGSFVFPKGNVLFDGVRLMVGSSNPTATKLMLDQFRAPLSAAGPSLTYYYDAGVGSDQVGEAMLWDYQSGSMYTTTRSNQLLRLAVKTAANGGVASTFVSGAAVVDQPYGVALDPLGNVYCSSFNTDRVQKITPAGVVTTLAAVNDPTGIDVDAAGNIWYVSWADARLYKVPFGGAPAIYASGGGLVNPAGVAVAPSGVVYVADNAAKKIFKYVPPSTTPSTFATLATGPNLIDCDPSGNLYVAVGSGVTRYTPAGVASSYATGLSTPTGVAYDPSTGNIIVTERTSGEVDRCTPGVTVIAIGLNNPRGVACDSSGLIYVANEGSDSITVIR